MSDAESLAKRIVEIIESERKEDLSSIQKSLSALDARLEKLETSLNPQTNIESQHSHPSQDRFAIAEAIVDQIFAGVSKERACTFEPNGKPCDHCSMCNSRGF